jgi:hypothetical protein
VTWCWRKEEDLLWTITMGHYNKVLICSELMTFVSIEGNLSWLCVNDKAPRTLEGQR